MDLRKHIIQVAHEAHNAAHSIGLLSSQTKNTILKKMAKALIDHRNSIVKENAKDVKAAKKAKADAAFIDRLTLTEKRIKGMSDSLLELTLLADPVGEVIKAWRRPNGLWIHKVRVPIGTVAIIYESRPNVTSDCIGLCLKSGNSVILRGGSESLHSNLCIYRILRNAASNFGLAEGAFNIVSTVERRAVDILLSLDTLIDVVIPRGGEGLIRKVAQASRIPVIKHYKGICHVYVDEWADLNMAEKICYNAKVQRPGVCNAMESMLVHKDVAMRFLPKMLRSFLEAGVKVKGCPLTVKIAKKALASHGKKKQITLANAKDYATEYLGLTLSVKVVQDLDEAIEHIQRYGSHHSDSIVTENYEAGLEFLKKVDSACVYINASTRFTDGYEFGMGAEIGISTDKLHARGPMALEELTTYKYVVFGNGQIRT